MNDLKALLAEKHRNTASSPIRTPYDDGQFPVHPLHWLGLDDPFVVVADTDVLVRDIVYSIRKNGRTTLINAANSGALRLYCCEHVVHEVLDHATRYAKEKAVLPGAYLERFREHYLPMLRVIPDGTVSQELLLPNERLRIARMHKSKDKPTIALSMALGAYMLTEDQGAWKAAYDDETDAGALLQWRNVLAGCGDANELQTLFNGVIAFPTIAGLATIEAMVKAARRYPLLVGMLLGIGFACGARLIARFGRNIKEGTWQVLLRLMKVYEEYRAARTRFDDVIVPEPDWLVCRDLLGARESQRRATLFIAARDHCALITPLTLRDELQARNLLYGRRTTVDALRLCEGMYDMGRGKWQLGRYATDILASASTSALEVST